MSADGMMNSDASDATLLDVSAQYAGKPDSADSQFTIMYNWNTFLDGVFGLHVAVKCTW